jgi:hypothetical protein
MPAINNVNLHLHAELLSDRPVTERIAPRIMSTTAVGAVTLGM